MEIMYPNKKKKGVISFWGSPFNSFAIYKRGKILYASFVFVWKNYAINYM